MNGDCGMSACSLLGMELMCFEENFTLGLAVNGVC